MVASLRKLTVDGGDRAVFVPPVSSVSVCGSTSGSTRSSVSNASRGAKHQQPPSASPSSAMLDNTPLASASASSTYKNASSSSSFSSSSCSTSAISSSSSSSFSSSPDANNNHFMVTPPMSLPSRGWGDSGGGFSGGSFRSRPYAHSHPHPHPHPTGLPQHHAAPTSNTSSSNYSLHGNSRHDCVAGGGGGGGGGGGSGAGAAGKGSGEQQQQQLLLRRLERFSLSDGFSSAEEETWGSEGEIEETAEAGRRHALITGVPSGQSYHLGASVNRAAASRNGSGDGGEEGEEEEEGEGGDEDRRGLLVKGGPRTTTAVVVAATATAAAIAPFCGNGGALGLGGGVRRKAAVGAGRAKRRACLVARASRGAGRGASADATQIIDGVGGGGGLGAGGGTGRQWCGDGSGGGSNRPRKVSRPLFIEIENKASEPPRVPRQTAAQKRAAAGRGYRSSSTAVGQQQQQQQQRRRRRRTGHVGSNAEDADDEQGDSDEEDAFCGCAQRCLRLADSWYRAVVGGPTRVKFSELDQIAEMPSEMP